MGYLIDNLLETKNQQELLQKLDETAELSLDRQFVMKDIGLSSRVFNHWASLGLVTNKLKVGDYRYEFSFIDLIWFNIIKELREFGFPLEKIKIVHENLMEPVLLLESLSSLSPEKKKKAIDAFSNSPYVDQKEKKEAVEFLEKEIMHPRDHSKSHVDLYIIPLHMYIAEYLLNRTETKLLIDWQGIVIPHFMRVSEEETRELMQETGFDHESYICLSLFKFIKRFIAKKENLDFIRDKKILNENELYILSLIREGKAKAITIKFAAQKPTQIEITEERKIFAESRLSETILKRHYQEIIIKTQDGNIAYANITTKKKLK